MRLFLLLFLTACESDYGGKAQQCFANMTCRDDSLACIYWGENNDQAQSICAPVNSLNIGGYMAPRCPAPTPCPSCEKCADRPITLKCPWSQTNWKRQRLAPEAPNQTEQH